MSEQPPGMPGEFSPGTLIAGYRLEERIGRGGMAFVYRAHGTRLERRVALKILDPGRDLDEAFRRRFIRESRAAAAVEDPHIIPVFDAGEADGVLFIAMRFVRGGDVRALIDRFAPLPVGRVAEIVSQVASALDAAHATGLVHRDVKPANMLLERSPAEDRPDHVYLSDFGLSKAATGGSGLTVSGQFLGTLDYVAPEQIRARGVDGRADQYALACSAFEMLCGQPPFRREQDISVMYAHLSEPPPSLRLYRPELPERADDVMAKALAKSPGDRYATCRDMAVALRQALAPAARGNDASPAGGTSAPSVWHRATRAAATPASVSGGEPVQSAAAGEFSRLAGEPAPPPEVAPQPPGLRSPTRPGLTDPSAFQPAQPADPMAAAAPGGAPPSRAWWRSPAPVAGICAAALVIAGGVAYLAGGGHGAKRHAGTAAQIAAPTAPGCSTATATAKHVRVRSAAAAVGGGPYAVAVGRHGLFDFVTTGTRIAVLKNSRTGLAPKVVRYYSVGAAAKGDVVTANGQFLLAAAGAGAVVISVPEAERGDPQPIVGTLNSPHGSLAAEVVTTANDDYAFVSVSGGVAVFDLSRALAKGFRDGFVGKVRLPGDALGMAGNGKWLYVVSHVGNGPGTLSVISVGQAETDPAHAQVSSVPSGCYPARILLSDSDKVVWVTARQSDALLAFSARRLLTDKGHALIASVKVGEQPVGMTLVNGSTILVADSDASNVAGQRSNLAVVRTTGVLQDRKPVLLEYVATGHLPHQFASVPGTGTVLVTVQDAHQLEAIEPANLP